MSEGNGKPDIPTGPQMPVIELVIRYDANTKQFAVGWPNVDDVLKLGMLEFAKMTLAEMRSQAGLRPQQGLVIPASGVKLA